MSVSSSVQQPRGHTPSHQDVPSGNCVLVFVFRSGYCSILEPMSGNDFVELLCQFYQTHALVGRIGFFSGHPHKALPTLVSVSRVARCVATEIETRGQVTDPSHPEASSRSGVTDERILGPSRFLKVWLTFKPC